MSARHGPTSRLPAAGAPLQPRETARCRISGRCRSNTSGRTITLDRPASSSRVRNTIPFAVPGALPRDHRAGHAHAPATSGAHEFVRPHHAAQPQVRATQRHRMRPDCDAAAAVVGHDALHVGHRGKRASARHVGLRDWAFGLGMRAASASFVLWACSSVLAPSSSLRPAPLSWGRRFPVEHREQVARRPHDALGLPQCASAIGAECVEGSQARQRVQFIAPDARGRHEAVEGRET